jgi:hypothetical protein
MDFSMKKMSISHILSMKKEIKFDTRFQRGLTWRLGHKQYFLDTIRRNWQTSKIFLWETKPDEYACVDGQQRLKTVLSFFSNEFGFSKEVSGAFSGKRREDLDEKQLKKINDYVFDVVFISNASINDVADFFIRLQMGVPLNAAEKLNAILGDVRDFVCEVSQHKFFKEVISVRDYRFSHRYLAAQIVLLGKEGAHNLKYGDLKEMYEGSLPEELQEITKRELDYLARAFQSKTTYIKNRATVISLYYFVHTEFDDLSLEGKRQVLRAFFRAFQDEYYRQKDLAEEDRDPELRTYQLHIVQAADTATAIEERHKILRRKFLKYEKERRI